MNMHELTKGNQDVLQNHQTSVAHYHWPMAEPQWPKSNDKNGEFSEKMDAVSRNPGSNYSRLPFWKDDHFRHHTSRYDHYPTIPDVTFLAPKTSKIYMESIGGF